MSKKTLSLWIWDDGTHFFSQWNINVFGLEDWFFPNTNPISNSNPMSKKGEGYFHKPICRKVLKLVLYVKFKV